MTIDPLPPLVVWIAAASIATLLAHASLAKLADRALFEQHLAAYRVPAALLGALAWAIPLAELAGAALLLAAPARTLGAAGAAALLGGYGAAMAWQLLHGRRPDCGCGGEPLPLSWALVVRNAVLAAVALVAAAPSSPGALGVGAFAVVAAAVLLATLLYAALDQVLRHHARWTGTPAPHRHRPMETTRWMP